MAIGNYFDSNRTITEHFQIGAAYVIRSVLAVPLIDPTEMLQYYSGFFSKEVWNHNLKCVSMAMVNVFLEIIKCCHSWTSIQKKGKLLQIPLWQGGVHEAKKCQDLCVLNWESSYDVMLLKSSTTFCGILICVIFRPNDMQEYYTLFGIFARDTGLYSLSVFYIDFQYTNVYSFCVLHNYHCGSFTRECHGSAALQAQTTSIYDVIGHR